MKILVTGGAGYIGSHMVGILLRAGHEVVILDDFSSGHLDAVAGGMLVRGSMGDALLLDELFTKSHFDAVMHFAGFIQVGESTSLPDKYYRNNVASTLVLLDAMLRHRVGLFIFSSSAAVFGEPHYSPIDEGHPKVPINPYGHSKLMIEQILADYDQAYGFRSVSLRYFNAAGADPGGANGERHDPETHLIPLVLQTASGRQRAITVFGRDFPTPDGTCIRDYIHVIDLCEAHLLALRYLVEKGVTNSFNLGNGAGHSVQQVIDAAQRVTGRPLAVIDAPRREGDAARLVAAFDHARRILGWTPKYAALDTIIAHAWRWECRMADCLPIQG